MDRLSAPLKRLGETVGGFTTPQKVLAVLGVAVLLLGGVAFWRWASAPTMTPLFSNLAMEDASAITDQLDGAGTAYELADGGTTILVPKDQVYGLRLDMSAAGLPGSSDTGYALLDAQGVTTSQFQQQTTWQRALEGELATTIGSIASVESARVQLAIPEDDVFTDTKGKPTASVLVTTQPGRDLSDSQVQSVVHLVSSSVEGMNPDDVTVVDAAGNLLSTAGAGATGLRDQQTADYETRVTASLQQVLDQVLGKGKAVATVTADLDFDATTSTAETFSKPEGTPLLSESTTKENYTGSGAAVGGQLGGTGILGPDNIAVPTGAENGTGEYLNESANRVYGTNKLTEQTQKAPGSVRRQSVSVVVDTAAAGDVDMQSLRDTVSAAAGIDATRGDVVNVTKMAFDTSGDEAAAAAAKEAAAAAAAEQRTQLITTGAVVLVILVLLVLALLGARRRRKAQEEDADEEPYDLGPLQAVAPEPVALDTSALPAGPDLEAIEAPRTGLVPLPPTDAARAREEVVDLVERQPDEVAELLRGWLVADKR